MNCPNCKASNAEDARFCGTCGHTLSATESSNNKMQVTGIEAPSLIGREIAGRYRVLQKLGEGGMGAVYKAEQISLKRQCAIKLLRPEVAGAQMLLQRFNAEAQVVAKLSHPNTVNIYDFGQDSDGALFIAMEFIEGKSLRSVVHQEAPLPLKRALQIAGQIAASLTDAHAHGIVHRDLKPDNVMLQDRGRQKDVVRVLDFGIAKLRDENRQSQFAMTQAGDMLGTPQYMAPEQIRGETIDGRTDIYALGGLMYEMITARLPFEAPTVMALLSKHLMETIVPPSQRRPDLQLPPAVDALILGAMAKNPAERVPTMEALGEQIAGLLATFGPATAQATAQVAAQSSGFVRPQAAASIPTPPAFSMAATGSPQFPPPSMPPPSTPATGGYVAPPPPTGAHVPPAGVPYNPYANAGSAPVAAPPPAKSNAMIWIVLALLVLGGGGALAYFLVAKKDTTQQGPGSGSGSGEGTGSQQIANAPADAANVTPPPQSVDAAVAGKDPWDKGSPPPSVDAAVESDDPGVFGGDDGGDDDDTKPTPKPTPKPTQPEQTATMVPECEAYARTIEKLARCNVLPQQSRDAMVQAVKQMRQSFAQAKNMPAAAKAQMGQACKQGNDAMQQTMNMYNCK